MSFAASEGDSDENEETELLDNGLNFSADELAAIKNVQDLIKKCRNICSKLSHSTVLSDFFLNKQKELNNDKSALHLVQEVSTRWNSTYLMIARIVKVSTPLNATFRDQAYKKKLEKFALSSDETACLKDLVDVLQIFHEATEKLSGEKFATVSMILPLFNSIRSMLPNESNMRGTKALFISALRKSFDHYSSKYSIFDNQVLITAAFLDPRFKKFSRFSNEESLSYKQTAKKFIRDAANKYKLAEQINSDPITSAASAKKAKLKIFDYEDDDELDDIDAKSRTTKEINEYLKENAPNVKNVLEYWVNQAKRYSVLSNIARRIFCVQATSVSAERLFSSAGYSIWDRRNSISPWKVDKMMVINQFLKFNELD